MRSIIVHSSFAIFPFIFALFSSSVSSFSCLLLAPQLLIVLPLAASLVYQKKKKITIRSSTCSDRWLLSNYVTIEVVVLNGVATSINDNALAIYKTFRYPFGFCSLDSCLVRVYGIATVSSANQNAHRQWHGTIFLLSSLA